MLADILEGYKTWNWAWTLPVALRYEPIRRALLMSDSAKGSVADIGCGPRGGLASLLDWPTIGIDVTFREGFRRQFPHIVPVQASAPGLPFADGTVSAAVCVDVLEHVPCAARSGIVYDAFRITAPGGTVCIGSPTGERARELETRLNDTYRARTGSDHLWLLEHFRHDVVSEDWLLETVSSAASEYMPHHCIQLIGNVDLRLWYWTTWLSLACPSLMQAQRLLFRPLFRWVAKANGPPAYRSIVVVSGGQSGAEGRPG